MIEIVAVLILLMIVAGLFVVETGDLLVSVISLGAVGFLAAIAFVFLGAPDVAIVQIGVEVISLIVLIRATIGRDVAVESGERNLTVTVVTVALVASAALLAFWSLLEFPEFGTAVMDKIATAPSGSYLETGFERTGAPNIVTAVLLDFRAYDTFGEATVLFCAVLGAISILRRSGAATGNDAKAGGDE